MYQVELIVQDATLGRLSEIANGIASISASCENFSRMRVAMAYASASGSGDLCNRLEAAMSNWSSLRKEWLISIDFGRTDPKAVSYLQELKNSEVKLVNGAKLLKRKLTPERCFHPKSYLVDSTRSSAFALFVGSANLTLSGLHAGTEHATAHVWRPVLTAEEQTSLDRVQNGLAWWTDAWAAASKVSDAIIKEYADLRLQAAREDDSDAVKPFASGGTYEVDLDPGLSWASAKYLWVETHELYKNRGKKVPGNQLDLKRGTRVYFGFAADAVPQNSIFGDVALQFEGYPVVERSMRFGNNSMDKINLPIPGQDGPDTYDNAVVRFERVGHRRFRICLGSKVEQRRWRKYAEDQGLLFELAGGRRFGFYS